MSSGEYCFNLGNSARDLNGAFATSASGATVFTTSLAARNQLNEIFSTDLNDLRFTSKRNVADRSSLLDDLDDPHGQPECRIFVRSGARRYPACVATRLGDGVMQSRQSSVYGALAVQAQFSESSFIQVSQTISSVTSAITSLGCRPRACRR